MSGVLNIAPAVSGNKKTKDPVCKGFALVDFKSEVDVNRYETLLMFCKLAMLSLVMRIKFGLLFLGLWSNSMDIDYHLERLLSR